MCLYIQVGDDKTVKQWSLSDEDEESEGRNIEPINTILGKVKYE